MITPDLPSTPWPRERRRRFRLVVLACIAIAATALALQYTAHALLPAGKTDTLWGVLTGLVLTGGAIDLWISRVSRAGRR